MSLLALIFHASVRHIRKSHGNAIIGLMMNMAQTLVMVVVFYFMFAILGLRGSAVRGDFLLYIMSGIFLFITHIKSIGAVTNAEGPTSPMMHHAPMSTIVAIASAALGTIYIQILSLAFVLFMYHVIMNPVEVYMPISAFSMLLLSWFTGSAIGSVFLALKPWFPGFVGILSQVYMRANMVTSGKMFLANTMPTYLLKMFDWNPLFHTIDQARGFTFINYNPHYSSVSYPVYVGIACLTLGLMGEFYTRQYASLSWSAKR